MHDFHWIVGTFKVKCRHCDVEYRLATPDEANFVHMTGTFVEDGPVNIGNNVVAVPVDFSLWS